VYVCVYVCVLGCQDGILQVGASNHGMCD